MAFKTKNQLYTSSDIKREAKAQLEGHWREAVLIALIPAIFSVVIFRNTQENTFIGISLEFISDFLVTGVTFGFMNLLRSQSYILEPLQEIVSPFRSEYFVNLLKIKLWKYLYITLWSLLFVIPGIVKALAYSQAELIYKDAVDHTGYQPDARACIEESQQLMSGYKFDLFMLDLSFIGWQILNVFTLGILSIWLTPYMTMSRVVYYENLSEKQYVIEESELKKSMPREEEIGKDPDDFSDFDDF